MLKNYSETTPLVHELFPVENKQIELSFTGDDMIFKLCAGRSPQTGQSLASQPTMSRLENSVDSKDLYRIGQELADIFVESYDG